jgi:hypothetical protein
VTCRRIVGTLPLRINFSALGIRVHLLVAAARRKVMGMEFEADRFACGGVSSGTSFIQNRVFFYGYFCYLYFFSWEEPPRNIPIRFIHVS